MFQGFRVVLLSTHTASHLISPPHSGQATYLYPTLIMRCGSRVMPVVCDHFEVILFVWYNNERQLGRGSGWGWGGGAVGGVPRNSFVSRITGTTYEETSHVQHAGGRRTNVWTAGQFLILLLYLNLLGVVSQPPIARFSSVPIAQFLLI